MALSLDISRRQGDFSLSVALEAGAGVLALFGASGSGKTTLVNIVSGLLKPDAGRVSLDGDVLDDCARGVHVPAHRRRIGYVFQDGRLFPHLSVRQNLLYGARFAGEGDRPPDLDRLTSLLGLEGLLARAPRTLSGGETQRVAIGRALLSKPRLLILDEPLANLDQPRKDEILPFLERLRDEAAIPMIYVSHSLAEVARLATNVAVLDQGRLAAFGPAGDVLLHGELMPAPERSEVGALIETALAGEDPDAGLLILRSRGNLWRAPRPGAPMGARPRLFVRARDVILATGAVVDISALNVFKGTISSLAPVSEASVDVTLDCGGDRLVARVTKASAARLGLAPGREVSAIIKAVAFERTA